MNTKTFEIEPVSFITTCKALRAASRNATHQVVEMRFNIGELFIESAWGGGLIATNGDFKAQLKVSPAMLAKVATLHKESKKTGEWIKCVLDDELKEIRFQLGGIKAKFL